MTARQRMTAGVVACLIATLAGGVPAWAQGGGRGPRGAGPGQGQTGGRGGGAGSASGGACGGGTSSSQLSTQSMAGSTLLGGPALQPGMSQQAAMSLQPTSSQQLALLQAYQTQLQMTQLQAAQTQLQGNGLWAGQRATLAPNDAAGQGPARAELAAGRFPAPGRRKTAVVTPFADPVPMAVNTRQLTAYLAASDRGQSDLVDRSVRGGLILLVEQPLSVVVQLRHNGYADVRPTEGSRAGKLFVVEEQYLR